jgi:hypothetical protein
MPLRQRLIDYFEESQKRNHIRPDLIVQPAVDAFTGIFFAGVLRRNVCKNLYSREDYLKTSVDIFIRGIEVKES